MGEYRLCGNSVLRLADDAVIPDDPANRDWAEYQEWLAGGGVPDPEPEPYEPPVIVPNTVSKLGLKRALDELGLWGDVKATIASDPDVQEEWDLAIEISRTDRLTLLMIAAMGFTDEEVDQLIIRAHELVRPAPASA
ncbi:MAG TPA: hypothetical protein VNZ94_00525 [Xanthobacteraceae bacterium]|nr:hypothetical protein [Xanthobacteraceae bacterium]